MQKVIPDTGTSILSRAMRVGRNDPCPCGSGQKYKKCCGAVIAPQPARRRCGACTACGDGWVAGKIRGPEMKPGQPCHFRGEGCCTIYAQRPVEPCRNFVCGWLMPDSPFPEEFRPDRLGVMAVPAPRGARPALILCSAGGDPDQRPLGGVRGVSSPARGPVFYQQRGARVRFRP